MLPCCECAACAPVWQAWQAGLGALYRLFQGCTAAALRLHGPDSCIHFAWQPEAYVPICKATENSSNTVLPVLGALTGSLAAACYLNKSSIECSEEANRPPTVRRVKVARAADFPEGELRQIRIPPTSDGAGEGAILLTRVDGTWLVLHTVCPSCLWTPF